MSAHQIDNGGPAFPHHEDGMSGTSSGMSLRDYFAAQAMIIAYQRFGDEGFARVATTAYALADVMLKEREKKGSE